MFSGSTNNRVLTFKNNRHSISPKYCLFFKELKENNNKPWFELNKDRFNEIKDEFTLFMADFITEIKELEPLPDLVPKKTVFRIYRDVRFSKDKTPYKTHIASVIDRGRNWQSKCGFYIHIEPGNSYIGGGAWEPTKEALKGIRQEIDYNPQELIDIIENPEFVAAYGKISGDKLKTTPKDYTADHPQIELLKHKQFLISKKFTDNEVVDKNFINVLLAHYKIALPFFNYFDVVFKEVGEKEAV
ncbi:MAG: DUF2461 domain-containing protein [Bacteroidota bacterium]